MEQHETTQEAGGQAFMMDGRVEAGVQVLIVLSLVAFSVETLPDLSAGWRRILDGFELFCVTVFTIEYGLRAWFSRPRRGYLLGFFGITDLLAILPYYIGLGVDGRSMRAFRLLRLFRVFKLVRYSQAIRRFRLALGIAREEIILFLAATAILLYMGSVGIYYFEGAAQPDKLGSVFDCLWWAVSTLTTVGYGDVYPITLGGKVFTFVLLLVGLGVISVPAGLVASALAKARRMEDEQ
jgi:voltage-gated potassium channel